MGRRRSSGRGHYDWTVRRCSLTIASSLGALLLFACSSSDVAETTEQSTVSTQAATELAVDDDATVTSTAAPSTTRESTTTTSTTTTTMPTTTSTTTTTTTIPSVPVESIALELELISTFRSPVDVRAHPTSGDLYVVEQSGRIVRLPEGLPEDADVALDLRGQVSLGNEQGLLGMAFDTAGERLYVDFTDTAGSTVIARYDMAGPIADAESVEILLTIPQPRGNHNGGGLAFGPDGFLYISMGDGGGGGDPFEHGQNPDTLHGSILRIDVSGDEGYTIPPDNPFLNGDAPEVFTWGIRNAWRFGFDSVTGDLWIGDVGQDRFEEVTVVRAQDGGGNGANLGWNEVEGAEPYRGGTIPADHVAPVITYGHSGGRCSVTGGEVYRGSAVPSLLGTYFYGDFCTGEVFGYRVDDSGEAARLQLPAVSRLSSFGIDADGEMLAVSRSGGLYRIVAA